MSKINLVFVFVVEKVAGSPKQASSRAIGYTYKL